MPISFACPICGAEVHWSMERCPKCSHDVGFPNRRELQSYEERTALSRRYEASREDADLRGALSRLDDFEGKVRADARAGINVWPSLLADFLNDGKKLYSNYTLQVQAELRTPASLKDDRQRRATEALLFGGYADQIRYAALALDERGLSSYGSCSISLSNVTASARATLLHENSYSFVRRQALLPGEDIPCGFRALWEDRHKLAAAKLAGRIHKGTRNEAFPEIVLHSAGDRAKDEFIEVHIYGAFDRQSVEAVRAPRPERAGKDRQNLERVRDWLLREGKIWMEE
jgi:hypothetical protein